MGELDSIGGTGAHAMDHPNQRREPAWEQEESLPLNVVPHSARMPIEERDTRKTSAVPEHGGVQAQNARIPAWFAWLASLAVVAVGLAIYARSVHILPLSDDWGQLSSASLGPQAVFFSTANYHYNPVAQGVMYVIYLLAGLNPVPYHIVALTLFSISVVLVLRIGWKVTGSFTIGVLASLLFVVSGRQYEGVVWTLVSIFQTLGLALYLGGLLCYLHAQGKQGRRRLWLLIGLYVCMILAIFTYEQEITLIVACMLYRLFVIEWGAGWNGRALLARARNWVIEFGFPVVFFAAYLGLKYWLSLKTGRSQAPGLSGGLEHTLTFTAFGLFEAFTPAITSGRLWTLELRFLYPIVAGTPPLSRWLHTGIVYAPLVAVILFAKPVYRWLALWSLLVVGSTILGIGYVASRYQLLFVVPAVILWAGFFVWTAKLLRGFLGFLARHVFMAELAPGSALRRWIAAIAWAPAIAMLVVFSVVGVRGALAQVGNWQQASDVEGAAIQRIADLGTMNPGAQTLYLVNLPDNVGSVSGPSARIIDRGAYLFQDGAPSMVELSLPGRFQTVHYLRTSDYFAIGTPVVMSRAEVDALSTNPANLVVCFSGQTRQIEPWGPLCT